MGEREKERERERGKERKQERERKRDRERDFKFKESVKFKMLNAFHFSEKQRLNIRGKVEKDKNE